MKTFLILFVVFFPAIAFSQMLLKPGNPCIEYKRITNERSTMIWYLLQDTTKIEIGRLSTDIKTDSQHLTVITTVKMRQSPTAWIDSTIADRNSLKTVYHSSYNGQRGMMRHFDGLLTGYDAGQQQISLMSVQSSISLSSSVFMSSSLTASSSDSIISTTSIPDSTATEFFDSNLYPMLIRWLPLRTGFTKDLYINDFSRNSNSGVTKVSVIAVRQCDYLYQDKELRRVYLVTVKDTGAKGTTTYYIDVETRKLWKIVMAAGERKMIMEAA